MITPTVKIEMLLKLFLIVAHAAKSLKCKKKLSPMLYLYQFRHSRCSYEHIPNLVIRSVKLHSAKKNLYRRGITILPTV